MQAEGQPTNRSPREKGELWEGEKGRRGEREKGEGRVVSGGFPLLTLLGVKKLVFGHLNPSPLLSPKNIVPRPGRQVGGRWLVRTHLPHEMRTVPVEPDRPGSPTIPA